MSKKNPYNQLNSDYKDSKNSLLKSYSNKKKKEEKIATQIIDDLKSNIIKIDSDLKNFKYTSKKNYEELVAKKVEEFKNKLSKKEDIVKNLIEANLK